MNPEHRAVIDVGTNSIKLLVADTAGGRVRPVLEARAQQPVRLGRGFYSKRSLRPESIVAAAQAVAQLAKKSRRYSPLSIRAVATSAVRDAQNGEELIRAVRDATGLRLEVLSGDREAEWVFRGVASDSTLKEAPLMILDVGGGSTEVVLSERGAIRFRQSFALGALRLLEQLQMRDPPDRSDRSRCEDFLAQFFGDLVRPVIMASRSSKPGATWLVGTGGTAAWLATMQGQERDIASFFAPTAPITRVQLSAQLELLWKMKLSERQ